jgi:hypothetical protein
MLELLRSRIALAEPLWSGRKTDGSLRIRIDYRKLNSITKLESYMMQKIYDILKF